MSIPTYQQNSSSSKAEFTTQKFKKKHKNDNINQLEFTVRIPQPEGLNGETCENIRLITNNYEMS